MTSNEFSIMEKKVNLIWYFFLSLLYLLVLIFLLSSTYMQTVSLLVLELFRGLKLHWLTQLLLLLFLPLKTGTALGFVLTSGTLPVWGLTGDQVGGIWDGLSWFCREIKWWFVPPCWFGNTWFGQRTDRTLERAGKRTVHLCSDDGCTTSCSSPLCIAGNFNKY